MILKFIAREDALAREPGVRPAIGQPARYIGRRFDPAIKGHPATEEPHCFNTERIDPLTLADLKRAARKGSIWPADDATAAECGVSRPNVAFADGVWTLKPATAPAKPFKKDAE